MCIFFYSDFCYGNEDLAFSISESIKLCVTVVAYAPESFRRCTTKNTSITCDNTTCDNNTMPVFKAHAVSSCSLQMLMVLEALVPCYLQKLKSNSQALESASVARDEIAAIAALATSLQALLYSVETLTRFVSFSLSPHSHIYPQPSSSLYKHVTIKNALCKSKK